MSHTLVLPGAQPASQSQTCHAWGQGSGVGRGGSPGKSTPFPGRTLWFGISLDTWAGPTAHVRGLSSGLAVPPTGHVTGQVLSPLAFCGFECKMQQADPSSTPPLRLSGLPHPSTVPLLSVQSSVVHLSFLFCKLDPVLPATPSRNPSVACQPPALAESGRAGPHTLPQSLSHVTANIPKRTGALPSKSLRYQVLLMVAQGPHSPQSW